MKKCKICLGLIILIAGIIISSTAFATTINFEKFEFNNFNNGEEQNLGTNYTERYKITKDFTYNKTLNVGEKLVIAITNAGGASWVAPNQNITSVLGTSQQVTVTALQPGKSIVYAKAKDGSGTYIYNITVEKATVAPATSNTDFYVTIDGNKYKSPKITLNIGSSKTVEIIDGAVWGKETDNNATTFSCAFISTGVSHTITGKKAGTDEYSVRYGNSEVIIKVEVKNTINSSSTPNTSDLSLTIDGQKCASTLDMYVGNVKTIITNKNVTWKKTVDGNATTYYNSGTSCKITAVRAGIDIYEVTDGTSKVIVQISVNNTSPAVPNANIPGNYIDIGGYRVWAKLGPRKNLEDVTNKVCTINQSLVSTAGTAFGIYLVPLSGNVAVNPNIYANNIPVSITVGDSSKVSIIVDDNLHGWAYGGGQSSNCLEVTATVIGKASTNGASIPIYVTLNGQKVKLFSIKVSDTVNEVKLTGSSNLRLNIESGKSQIEVGKDAGLTLGGYTGVWQPDGISTKIVWSSNNQSVISILHPELQTSTWNTAKAVGAGTATVTARIYAYDTKTRAQLKIKIAEGQYVDYFEVSGNITVIAATTPSNQSNPSNPSNPSNSSNTSNPSTPSKIHTSKVILSQERIDLKIGDIKAVVATKYPLNSEDSITWKSSSTSVATVDSNGNVKAVGEGAAVITATSGSYSETCIVIVTKKQVVETIEIDDSATAFVGETKQLIKKITPDGVEEVPQIEWSSDKTEVATVDSNGLVKGISKGTAIITATVKGTNIKDVCFVTVEEKSNENDNLIIDEIENVMKGIPKNTNISNLIADISKTKDVTITDKKGNIVTDKTELIGTGDKIVIGTKEYTAVVSGDSNGDGKVETIDLLKTIKDILEIQKLDGAYKEAADINGDGKVDIKDLAQIIKLVLE